jgi:hypothetical protein
MYAEDISRIPASICEVFDDPSDNYWMLQTMIKEIMDEHAPTKTMKVRAKETPFMNGDLRRSVRMKTRLHNIYRKHPTKQNSTSNRETLQRTLGGMPSGTTSTVSAVMDPETVISGRP